MQQTIDQVLHEVTVNYLQSLDPDNIPDAETITSELIEKTVNSIDAINAVRGKGKAWPLPRSLHFSQIADILLTIHPFCRICCSGENADSEYDLLGLYCTDGPNRGIYNTSESEFWNLARAYNYTLSKKDFAEVINILKNSAPRKTRTQNRDLIAVNNGIFDYASKQLMPFGPEYVFTSKSRVDYKPNPANPVIHNDVDGTDWDIESWMDELSDDPEIINVLWEIMGAILRPFVSWNKSAWFYSEAGNNGKGTLCQLMRGLCGFGSFASIKLVDFGKDFALEPLVRSQAIIVDENDVGTFIDKAANLKAVITNDIISINRKFKQPIAYQFFGFMVQCLNEFPRIKDKSDSFYRRQLFIPFNKCFTGHERKYIKDDYLKRPEVLEYAMHKVLHMDYYSLSEPASCKAVLDEYKEFNDPVRQFFEEFSGQLAWDAVPFTFLYDLYLVWFKKNCPSGSPQGRNTFINDLIPVVADNPDWDMVSKSYKFRPGTAMDKPEPLSDKYDLKDWLNPWYKGSNPLGRQVPPPQTFIRGILRTYTPLWTKLTKNGAATSDPQDNSNLDVDDGSSDT